MGKILGKYRGFTPMVMKSRSSIPVQGDIVVNENTIDCSNISLLAVKELLGAATYSLYDLCRHANVNRWSGWGPTIRSVVGGVLTNSVPTVCKLGDFAGYNHSAITPHYESSTHDDDVEIQPGATATFTTVIHLGEARLVDDDITDVSDTDRGLALIVYDGASILTRVDTTQVIDIHDLKDSAQYHDLDKQMVELSTSYTIPAGQLTAKQFTCKVFLVNNLTGFASDLSNSICQFTELPNYTKLFKVLRVNHVYLNGPENGGGLGTYDAGTNTWTFGKWELKDFSWSTANGQLSFQYLKLNARLTGTYNHLSVSVKVQRGYYDSSSNWVGTDIAVPSGVNPIYNDGWNSDPPNESVGPISNLDIWNGGTIDTSGYGYRIYIDCNTTTV